MRSVLTAIAGLLSGVGIMLLGNGLLSTVLVLKASAVYSDFVIGLIMSMYFAGAILGTLYLPRLIGRIGHIRAYTIMASIAACSVLLHGMLLDPIVWGLLRMIMGLATVGIYMIIESWLNEIAAHQNRGRVLAVYMMVTLIALAASQFLVLLNGADSGKAFMIAAGLIMISLVPIASTRLVEPKPLHTQRLGVRRILRRSPLGLISVFCSGLATGVFWALGPLFAKQYGPLEVVPLFMSSAIMGGFILQWPIGLASDRWGRYKILIVISLLCAATAAFMAFTHIASLFWLCVLMFFLGGYLFSVYPLSVSMTNDSLSHDELVDASGNLLLVQGVGAMLGPMIAGALMAALDANAFFYYLLSVMLALALLTGILSRKRPLLPDEQSNFVPMTRTSQVAFEIIEDE